MPIVAFTTLWLAASAPAVPATENNDAQPAPAAANNPPDGRNTLTASQPPATTIKKTGSDNDEPGCEE